MAGKVSRLVLAIISKETREVVERWQFDVALENQKAAASGQADDEAKENEPVRCVMSIEGAIGPTEYGPAYSQDASSKPPKTEKEIHQEIQAIIRQITASVTFLPVIEEKCEPLTTA